MNTCNFCELNYFTTEVDCPHCRLQRKKVLQAINNLSAPVEMISVLEELKTELGI